MTDWTRVRELPAERLDLDGYGHVPDTGFTMLIAWLAGPDRLLRVRDHVQHTVRVTVIRGAARTSYTEPRTQADQDSIDDDVDEYLADARVPGPPRGFRWYQRTPRGCETLEEAYARINASLRDADPDGEAVRPEQLAPLLADAVAALYQR